MENNIKVVVISGKAGNGKDTAANIIYEQLQSDGHRVLITHYADLVKYICKTFFKWDGVKDENGRHLLQYVGTDVVRSHDPNTWVNFIIKILEYFGDNWDYVLIPDCRFPNEISEIKDNGFDTIHLRIVREGYDGVLTSEQKMHASETALDDVTPDYLVKNNSSIEELENKLHTWVKETLYGR